MRNMNSVILVREFRKIHPKLTGVARLGCFALLMCVCADMLRAAESREPDSSAVGMEVIEVMLDENTILELVKIPAGASNVGSSIDEDGRLDDEFSARKIEIGQPFWMGKFEVTKYQYGVVMDLFETTPRLLRTPERPITYVSWLSAQEFCTALTAQERAAGRLVEGFEYRLPSENEWEYACRAGSNTPFGIGDGLNLDSSLANFDGEYSYGDGKQGPTLGKSVKVGSYEPNGWGLYDMHGNVWEWCIDPYRADHSKLDEGVPVIRSIRGGGWTSSGRFCRSAVRLGCSETQPRTNTGFRIVLGPKTEVAENAK